MPFPRHFRMWVYSYFCVGFHTFLSYKVHLNHCEKNKVFITRFKVRAEVKI